MNSQISPADTGSNIIRSFLSFFDKPAYWLLTIIYQLFFNVASADLFAGDTIMKFFGRVQLILGVFMMFQLAMTILKGIVNPDSFMDSKSGAYNLVYRIAVALIMLTLLVPFRTAGSNQLEVQISNNGILFGTLYDLQHRLLENNTIGRLILGSNDTSGYFSSKSGDAKTEEEQLAKSARVFSSTILKGFYRINLLPEDQWPPGNNYEENDPAIFNDVRVCSDIDDAVLETYTKEDANPLDIIDMVNLTCNRNYQTILSGNNYYIFAYTGFVSMIVGFLFVAILLSFTVDIAVRSVKLAVLRLIAPIPIISYMDPKGSKDSAFNSWVKTLTSTYIDIFIRLAVVYFVIFLIQDMIDKGVVIKHGTGTLGIISWIILWVGLFVFAKQSPAFIKKVLGMKDEGGFGLFSGLDSALGVGALAAGTIGSAVTNFRTASEEGKELYKDKGLIANTFGALRTGASTFGGAVGGLYYGGKAFAGKDGGLKKVLEAQSARNAARMSHQTLPGKFMDSAYGMFTGQSLAEAGNKKLKVNQDAFKTLKDYKTTIEDEALKKNDFYGRDSSGREFNYTKLAAAVERARSSGHDTFDYSDGTHTYTGLVTDMFDENEMNGIKSKQAESYSERLMRDESFRNGEKTAKNAYLSARKAASDASISFDGSYDSTKVAMGTAKSASTESETDMRSIMRRANNQQKK